MYYSLSCRSDLYGFSMTSTPWYFVVSWSSSTFPFSWYVAIVVVVVVVQNQYGSLSPPLIYGLVRTRSDAIVDPQLHYLPLGGFFKYDVLEEYDMRRQCPQLFTIKVKPGTRHSTQQNIIIFQVLKHLNIQKVVSIRVHFFRQTAHKLIF